MTDRSGIRDGAGDEPDLAMVERRLGRRNDVEPSPAFRDRVLMAVDDVLAAGRPTIRRDEPAADLVWPWAVAVAVGGLAIVVAFIAYVSTSDRIEPFGLLHRMQVAGVADDRLLASDAAPRPSEGATVTGQHDETRAAAAGGVFRAIDARRLLREDL
jgi:hypothetical protein